jgi:hypothetical protein
MATFEKFYCFTTDLGLEKHSLHTDALFVYLTNAQPVVGNTVYNTPADIATKNGYTQRGQDVLNTWADAGSGVATLSIGSDVVWTGSTVTDGTGFGPFRWAVLFNETAPADELIGWWTYPGGVSITVLDTETFTFDMTSTLFTVT